MTTFHIFRKKKGSNPTYMNLKTVAGHCVGRVKVGDVFGYPTTMSLDDIRRRLHYLVDRDAEFVFEPYNGVWPAKKAPAHMVQIKEIKISESK